MNLPEHEAPAAPAPRAGARWLTMALCAFAGSGMAMLGSRWLVPLLPVEPVWLGPALVIGALALALLGVLCTPAAMRHLAAQRAARH